VFRWDLDGVDILGAVSVTTGERILEWPLKKKDWGFLQSTTSTAV